MENTDNTKRKAASPSRIQEFSEKRALFMASIEVLKAKKTFILLTFFLATSGTLLGHFFQTTTFTGTASLFVQALEEPTAAEYLLNHQVGRINKSERIETYMRYLSSDSFFIAVAQKLKFHEDFEKMNLTPTNDQSLLSFQFWKTKTLQLFSSSSSIPADIKNKKMSTEALIGNLKSITSYSTDYSHFVFIKTKALEPRTAQVIANIAAEEFVAVTNERGIQEIEQIKSFVESKILETEDRLRKTELELIEFKKKNSIISTDRSSSLVAERFSRVSAELESAKLQLEENSKLISFFENGQKANLDTGSKANSSAYGVKETTFILQRKIEQLKKEKAIIIAQEDKNQETKIKELDKEINKTFQAYKAYSNKLGQDNLFIYMNPQKLQQKINELKEENEILKNKISTHLKASEEVKAQIEKIPILAQKQILLENSIQLDTENYTNLKNKLTELEIQRISQKKEVKVDQVSQLPSANAKGNLVLKLLFSTLISLFLGICIIIGIEALDPTVKHRSDLQDCNLDFIGEIPLINSFSAKKRTNGHFADPEKIVCIKSPESIESMAFKYIRARLESYKYKFKKEHMIISISSSAVSEGKSFIAANTAVCLSQLKRKVLIIDADLRRPSQNGYFDVTNTYGLVDLLSVNKTLDEVIVKDLYPQLDYLPAGFCNANSTEIISSETFKALLNYLKSQYDYVVIDCPPVFAAVDASIISSYSDIPILIANFRETKKVNLNEAYNNLLQVSYKRVFGIINKAILSTARFHYYGYHNYSKTEQNLTPMPPSNLETKDIDKFLEKIKRKTS
jgi:polysaccharide biosynthesis transport protein